MTLDACHDLLHIAFHWLSIALLCLHAELSTVCHCSPVTCQSSIADSWSSNPLPWLTPFLTASFICAADTLHQAWQQHIGRYNIHHQVPASYIWQPPT